MRRVHLDEPARGGGRVGRQRQRGTEPGPPRDQHRPRGAPPDRGRGRGGRPRGRADQLSWRETAHAPTRRLPIRSDRCDIYRLQHVNIRYLVGAFDDT